MFVTGASVSLIQLRPYMSALGAHPRSTSGRVPQARSTIGLVVVLSLPLLAACEGDTLYDRGDITGPGPGAPPSGIVGVTVPLPNGVEQVGDLVVDQARGRLYVSNRGGHTVEVLEADVDGRFRFRPTAVPVGSQPWGMSLNRGGDSLIVANSGGTNFSLVALESLREERRYQIPRTTLHEVSLDLENDTCEPHWYNYTDRPQFVTQDRDGRLLYSAGTSAVAPVGTIRMAYVPPAGERLSSHLLFPGLLGSAPMTAPPLEARGVEPGQPADEETGIELDWAIANVDSITYHTRYDPPFANATCAATLHDHVPGTRQYISAGPQSVAAMEDLITELYDQGSDVVAFPGHLWAVPEALTGMDTTYVAVSGNRALVAFAEGVRAPDARVTLWSAESLMSRQDDMADLMNNTSDRISSVALNVDGSLGVARGTAGAYFFDRDLRLLGTASSGLAGGLGAAILRIEGDGAVRDLAFLGTTRSSIQVVETTNYRPILELPISGNVTGPLRVGAWVPGVGVTVYAVTEGGILVLDVPADQVQ